MTKIVHATALLMVVCATVLLAATAIQWSDGDSRINEILARPSALDRFAQARVSDPNHSQEPTALIAQAKILASYLTPPPEPPVAEPRPAVRPPAVAAGRSLRFQLCATSCYPSKRDRSMALISELPNRGTVARWVKEGSQVGHLVVQEIRCGSVVWRDGDRLVEMFVQRRNASTSLVRGHSTSMAQADSSPHSLLEVDSDSVPE